VAAAGLSSRAASDQPEVLLSENLLALDPISTGKDRGADPRRRPTTRGIVTHNMRRRRAAPTTRPTYLATWSSFGATWIVLKAEEEGHWDYITGRFG